MKNIIISGHYYYGGCHKLESSITYEFANMLHWELEKQAKMKNILISCKVKNPKDTNSSFSQSYVNLDNFIKECNANRSIDLIVDLHTNALNGSAFGTVVFVLDKTNQGNKELAKEMCNVISLSLGTYNRGLRYENFNVLSKTNTSAILVELFFHDFALDVAKYNANKDILAKNLAECILKNFKV